MVNKNASNGHIEALAFTVVCVNAHKVAVVVKPANMPTE